MKQRPNAICKICQEWKVVRSRGMCNNCYRAFLKEAKRSGTFVPLITHSRQTPFEKVMGRTDKQPDGCWLYTGALMKDGYARVKDTSTDYALLTHRVVYEQLVGPVPEGLVLDHLCRVRHCVNPQHLEPVTVLENNQRGVRARLGERTHCAEGHEFTPENTVPQRRKRKSGVTLTPVCRTCRNAYYRAKSRRHKEG
ncbi:HNH endonuclease signature motif containing protein [Streptomyces europaeiscabiei]|uniref:HNH endonuclease signature motif containing protein n=1 Tax=Streptomyces europaeiscabiei TaxID=146819 RepID=UPI0029B270EF|nr:HNH endonuclease signature motif containing protein [Streptomyces europaeiscabiei]MDX3637697.1 HNH endonuclease signature motif containing protein [Streptomyces europaeiscabiei]MDX3655528.1 HNH endonuclease signature motif containing protein [Streptomyces europaeiscabiei]